MSKHRVIFFNGPPHSGKDSAVAYMATRLHFHHLKFADPLKDQCCALLGITRAELEFIKDLPHPVFNGGTPRQYLISLSEKLIKPIYGARFFGHASLHKMKKIGTPSYIFFSDSGFQEEAVPVVNDVGIENCVKLELHRPGKDFSKDSRSYWTMPDLKNILIANSGDLNHLYKTAYEVVCEWMDSLPPLPNSH